ncbi:MAG: GntR family transcriptional regulator [Olsenella sp.]|nr:GntR family transcriptional regulator [Olsenella sp.]
MSEQADPTSSFPLYMQVLAHIQYDIDSGAYGIGESIPSESELEQRFSVSRITIRRAVQELVDAGYLIKRPGKGTFVREKSSRLHLLKSLRDVETKSFTEACEEAGYAAGSIELGCKVVEPTEEDCAFFALLPDEKIISLKRVHTANGIPVMANFTRFPESEFAYIEHENLQNRSLYESIRLHKGCTPKLDGECILSSESAVGKLAEYLSVPEGEPLFRLNGHYVDGQNRPLMTEEQIMVGSRYSIAL